MGLYDTFVDGNIAIQIKCTNDGNSIPTYEVGDEINMEDCVLIGFEGAVVIKDNEVVMITENIMDKWGVVLDCEDIIGDNNPIKNAVDYIMNAADDLDETIDEMVDEYGEDY